MNDPSHAARDRAIWPPAPAGDWHAALVHGLPSPVILLDAGLMPVYANPAAGANLGLRPPPHPLPRDLARALEPVAAQVLETGGEAMREVTVGGPAGRRHWEVRVRPAAGRPGVTLTMCDITDRRPAHAGVPGQPGGDPSRDPLAWEAADTAPVLLWLSDPSGRVVFANQAWREFGGADRGGDVVDSWVHRLHPDDAPRVIATWLGGLAARQPVAACYRVRRADGAWRWVDDRATPRFGPDGEFLGYSGAGLDITEAREVAQALAESEARHRLVAENASDLIVRRARDGTVLYASPASARILGLTPEEYAALGPGEICHTDDVEAVRAAWRRLFEGGAPTTLRYRLRHAAGHHVWVETTYLPVLDDAGLVCEVNSSTRDACEQVAAEERERERAREREELVAVVSHELRAPLGALEGLLWLALGEAGQLPPPVRASLESALTRLSRLRRLASDLVVMTQLDAHALQVDRREIDLAGLVNDLVAGARPEAERLGISIDVHTRRTPLLADPDRVGQVVDNLLANALKFSPPGGRIVVRVGGDLDTATVSVEDQGPGIPPDERERVFRRFHRAPGAAGTPGSGLGLAIAQAIAQAHQGRVVLRAPRVGSGLVAEVQLPRDPGP